MYGTLLYSLMASGSGRVGRCELVRVGWNGWGAGAELRTFLEGGWLTTGILQ